jgi:hypothetical protein
MLYVMLVGAYPFERPEDKHDNQKLQKMIQVGAAALVPGFALAVTSWSPSVSVIVFGLYGSAGVLELLMVLGGAWVCPTCSPERTRAAWAKEHICGIPFAHYRWNMVSLDSFSP